MAPGVLAITGELLDAVGEPLPYGVGALAWIGAYRLCDDQRIRVVAAVMGFLGGLVLAALP